jgi:hypothetical protein
MYMWEVESVAWLRSDNITVGEPAKADRRPIRMVVELDTRATGDRAEVVGLMVAADATDRAAEPDSQVERLTQAFGAADLGDPRGPDLTAWEQAVAVVALAAQGVCDPQIAHRLGVSADLRRPRRTCACACGHRLQQQPWWLPPSPDQ